MGQVLLQVVRTWHWQLPSAWRRFASHCVPRLLLRLLVVPRSLALTMRSSLLDNGNAEVWHDLASGLPQLVLPPQLELLVLPPIPRKYMFMLFSSRSQRNRAKHEKMSSCLLHSHLHLLSPDPPFQVHLVHLRERKVKYNWSKSGQRLLFGGFTLRKQESTFDSLLDWARCVVVNRGNWPSIVLGIRFSLPEIRQKSDSQLPTSRQGYIPAEQRVRLISQQPSSVCLFCAHCEMRD